MGLQNTKKNKNILMLAVLSAIGSVLFSFMGAPFLRAFSVTARSSVFWLTGTALVGLMFLGGADNYKILEAAVYVGAIWMTLGAYTELEKRGVNWRGSVLFSLAAGLLFALIGYFAVLKARGPVDALTQLVEPMRIALNQAFPQQDNFESTTLIQVLPGIFVAALLGSLALGLAFEAKIVRLFGMKREKIASSLRWLEFRLPDAFIWMVLFATLSQLDVGFLNNSSVFIVGVNVLIVSCVALFFQGIAVTEFMIRFYRLGLFTRTAIYLLIVLQLAPLVVLLGFVDYWADFRKLVRRKIKTN